MTNINRWKETAVVAAIVVWTTGPAQLALIPGAIAVGAVWASAKIGEKFCTWNSQRYLRKNDFEKYSKWLQAGERCSKTAEKTKDFLLLYLIVPAIPVVGLLYLTAVFAIKKKSWIGSNSARNNRNLQESQV